LDVEDIIHWRAKFWQDFVRFVTTSHEPQDVQSEEWNISANSLVEFPEI
jgi:hypothetical protein